MVMKKHVTHPQGCTYTTEELRKTHDETNETSMLQSRHFKATSIKYDVWHSCHGLRHNSFLHHGGLKDFILTHSSSSKPPRSSHLEMHFSNWDILQDGTLRSISGSRAESRRKERRWAGTKSLNLKSSIAQRKKIYVRLWYTLVGFHGIGWQWAKYRITH